jgi:hypothetical protein
VIDSLLELLRLKKAQPQGQQERPVLLQPPAPKPTTPQRVNGGNRAAYLRYAEEAAQRGDAMSYEEWLKSQVPQR